MNTKHTPGPWTILPDPVLTGKHPLHECRYVTTNHQPQAVYNDNGQTVSWHFDEPSAEVVCTLTDSRYQKANARLIAAAPELLEALQRLVKRQLEANTDYQAITVAQQAIHRATQE